MIRTHAGRGLVVLACVLVGGCSSHGGGGSVAADRHDPGVRLSPDPAYAAARISVVLEDPRIPSAKCKYSWRRNGVQVVGASTDGLDPSYFSRGDEIAVAVSAPDPTSGVVRTLNAVVRVENTPPKLTRNAIMMVNESGATVLKANVECADQDGDVLTYTYRWFKNDAPIDNANGPTLPAARVARGDRVSVEVVARDEASVSSPLRSDPYTLANRPPEFSSQPVAPKPADVAFQYQAVATDLDGDPLRYELVSGPSGMTVDPSGGVYWRLPPGALRRGTYPVRLRAIDARGGEATQDFTISLDPPPAKS